jgi:hypothetical protein
MNKAFFKTLDRAIALASQHEQELLSYPGVITVGAGPERKAGKLTGKAAIVVTVRAKKSPQELAAQDEKLLPNRLGEVPVDVIELDKPVEAPEIVAAQEKATRVLEQVKDKWLKTANVTGIGVGYKTINGQMDFNVIALKIFVAKKLPLPEVRKQKMTEVPAKIEGVVTDVEEMPVLRPTSSASGSRDDRKDPLVGGVTVGVNTKPFWYGTLGAIVFDRTTGEQMVLSNQHVLDGPAGTEVVQPSPIGLDDSLEISFQLDICNPLHFFRLDTPNTTVGSVLAGAAVAAVVAAALSDEIDPTRRGQEATPPPVGAKTLAESQKVRLDYPEMPIPGTHFKVKTDWQYTRHTDAGDRSHSVDEVRENPHVLADKLLLTDKKLYRPGETIRLFGLILPESCAPKPSEPRPNRPITATELKTLTRGPGLTPPNLAEATTGRASVAGQSSDARRSLAAIVQRGCRCDRYHLTAILTPTTVDRAFPVVLREPISQVKAQLLSELLEIVKRRDDRDLLERVFRLLRYGCFYFGELTVGNIPIGPWKHYLYVQTVNFTPEGIDPVEAAKIIGGLPVSQNTRPNLDIACGPVVFEDGQFDIELL